jgi:hypothetical protein
MKKEIAAHKCMMHVCECRHLRRIQCLGIIRYGHGKLPREHDQGCRCLGGMRGDVFADCARFDAVAHEYTHLEFQSHAVKRHCRVLLLGYFGYNLSPRGRQPWFWRECVWHNV